MWCRRLVQRLTGPFVVEDPAPEYSALDRRDGLQTTQHPRSTGRVSSKAVWLKGSLSIMTVAERPDSASRWSNQSAAAKTTTLR